jgi:hypothetical protein
MFSFKPDEIIGEESDPYLLRWWIFKCRWFNIYLHRFLRDDDDRALHDHPWNSFSILLKGKYCEARHLTDVSTIYADPAATVKCHLKSKFIYRKATYRHRVILLTKTAWTIFITGPKIRDWGFWCEGNRFVPWQEFCDERDHGKIGKGCG